MRVVGICGVLLAVVLFLTFKKNEKTSAAMDSSARNEIPVETIAQKPVAAIVSSPILATNRTGQSLTFTNSIEERIQTLQDLSTSSEPEALQKIIVAFGDADPQIRKAAVEAATQFGSRDAIPALQEMEARVEDPREKVEILDAIEFLKLPSLSEIRSSRRNQ